MSVHIVYNFRTQQHRTVLKIIISQMMSTGEEGHNIALSSVE